MSFTHSGIPIIDIFAGPGGLGEGFSSVVNENNERVFNIKLSIEKDSNAHKTLTLRSFLRKFPVNSFPPEYYSLLHDKIVEEKFLDELYSKYEKEFIEASDEAWKATLGETPDEEVDLRIKNALNGEINWVLIGGPPCQAYSLVGRSRVGGVHQEDHRVYLYKQYLRIIAAHQPAVFVMENVKGLLSAQLNGEKIFKNILSDLEDLNTVFEDTPSSKYKIYSLVREVNKDSDYLIRAEEYGVPQKRHRVILLGVREDISKIPDVLIPKDKVDLKSVIGKLPKLRSGIYRSYTHTDFSTTSDNQQKKHRRYVNLTDTEEGWTSLVTGYLQEVMDKLGGNGLNNIATPKFIGVDPMFYEQDTLGETLPIPLANWFHDEKLSHILHHVSRSHLTQDLKRYLFASLYTEKFKRFPRMEDYKKYGDDLVPDHDNASSGKFSDRFRVQVPDEPATTVTSHISKDGHYFIHYDPVQCRSLTVREAARIQTFPDNYFFCGSRTQQFHQVGNAVPPYLAKQIAEIIVKLF